MSSSSKNGSNGLDQGIALADNGNGRTHSQQLSLLPEYTENGANESGKKGTSDASPSKWWTILALVLLAVIGFGVWRWWQGRSPSQSQQRGPQASPVELATVETATVEETSTFTGTLEADQASAIQAEQSGRVAQILVAQGQPVNAGTPLVRLSAEQEQADVDAALARIDIAQAAQRRAESELEALRAERDRVQAEINLQEEQFSRTTALVERGALAREELDLNQRDLAVARADLNSLNRRIQAAQDTIRESQATLRERQANLQRIRENLQGTTITAPFAGVIGDIPIEQGDYVQPGQSLTQVVANENLDLNISIPQERAADLETGLPVEIISSRGDELQTGRISFISPQVEQSSQFIPTEATFPNNNGHLRDGQFVRSEVIWESRPGQPVVPQSAVIYQGEDRFVYVPQEQDGNLVAMRQPVELGLEQGTDVEILSGVEPGQEIIVSGIQRLGDGVPIQPESQTEGQGAESSESPEDSQN
jgi:multidrug efflux pump subunit AcrA (membrane-fusion protein)